MRQIWSVGTGYKECDALAQVDYTFFNLETGELAQLYQPQVASFYDPRLTGSTPITDLETQATVYPRYYAPSDLNGPAGTIPTLAAFLSKLWAAAVDSVPQVSRSRLRARTEVIRLQRFEAIQVLQ